MNQLLHSASADPVDIHAAISALTVFNISNRYTFGTIFARDDRRAKAQTLQPEHVVQLLLRCVGRAVSGFTEDVLHRPAPLPDWTRQR